VRFWPLERWELATSLVTNADSDLIVLADHGLSSWWYAARSSAADTPILIVDGLRPASCRRVIVGTFIDAVFGDDSCIYPEALPPEA
jgi:hypothetical protein